MDQDGIKLQASVFESLGTQVVRMGDEWNWLCTTSKGRLQYMVEFVSSATRELVNQYDRSQGDKFWGCEVDGTGPEHCPMMRFSVNGVETLGPVITVLNGDGFTSECRILLLTITRASSNQS